jgi:hypothetical protein
MEPVERSRAVGSRRAVTAFGWLGILQMLTASGGAAVAPAVELFPKHFVLKPGERIHYQVLQRSAGGELRFADATFTVEHPNILRVSEGSTGVLEAMKLGRAELVVRTPTAKRRVSIEVAGRTEPPIAAVPYTALKQIAANELLFVGHANLDGWDHTAVAKPGVDSVIQQARKDGATVVYFVSSEYPDWYTAERRPDYAVISEGQEHQIDVRAKRVTFVGGSFMFCLLRNAQMTLHGMLKRDDVRRIDFRFPASAIWVEDLWGPGEQRPYPAPMVLLQTLFARRADDARAYDAVVVPFLDRLITQFPVGGYPAAPPLPALSALLEDWNVVVRFGDRLERVYRRAASDKTWLIEFQDVTTGERRPN